MKGNPFRRLKHSLLSKYLMIVLGAITLMPVSVIVVTLLISPLRDTIHPPPSQLYNGVDLAEMWHAEARQLSAADPERIDDKLMAIQADYPESTVFWVDAEGTLQHQRPEDLGVPAQWSATYTVDFMKQSFDSDPFTSVAFIGADKQEGFMVFRVPRSFLDRDEPSGASYDVLYFGGVLLILALFLFISWVFFYRIRKRLLRLQHAMHTPDETGVPLRTQVENEDEIGKLERAFNRMIDQLEQGRIREQEEEALRRQLIANLSHDLRTPLTTIRGHAHRLQQEGLTPEGKASLELMDRKIAYLDQLIDNLLSYTLLSAGKYPYHPTAVDMSRLARNVMASWYPVFEKEGFEIELDVPDRAIRWTVDAGWMERVLDNLLQNVMRHAEQGRYIAISLLEADGALVLEDRGPGMNSDSSGKGAGIGLTIVSLMLEEMGLAWDVNTSEKGTQIRIRPV